MIKKGISLFVICLVSLLGLVSCSKPDVPADTPVRVGIKGTGSAVLNRGYSFNEAYNEAELVADVSIASWLYEKKGDLNITVFKATVNTCLKGDCEESIELVQFGSSDLTFENHPLFKNGDRMFLFLTPHPYVEGAYETLGSFSTVMDIHESAGVMYVLDRCGIVTEDFVAANSAFGISAVTIDVSTKESLRREMKNFDPILYRSDSDVHRNVVLYSDIMLYTDSLMGVVRGKHK